MSDQLTNILFVGEVEKHPILYNFHLSGYSKKHETEKAWKEVGSVVNLTVTECKRRWKNIRAVFVRHMKPSKSSSGTKEKKAYYLEDALQFTIPYIKTLWNPSGDLSQPPLEEEEGLAINDGGGDEDDDSPLENPSPSPSALPASKLSSCSSTSALPHAKKEHAAKEGNADLGVLEYLDIRTAKGEQEIAEPKKEALKMFLLSMLPDLMQMDNQEVRQFKRKMLDAVDDILSAKSRREPT